MRPSQAFVTTAGPLASAFVQDKYTRSLCYLLAWHLHHLTHWNLAVTGNGNGPSHAFVVVPGCQQDYALGIQGLHEVVDLADQWNAQHWEVQSAPEFVDDWRGLQALLNGETPAGNEGLSQWAKDDAQQLLQTLAPDFNALGIVIPTLVQSR